MLLTQFSLLKFLSVIAGGIVALVLIEASWWWNSYTREKKIKDAERALVLGLFFVACFLVLTPLSWYDPTSLIAFLGGAWFYSLMLIISRREEFLAELVEETDEE